MQAEWWTYLKDIGVHGGDNVMEKIGLTAEKLFGRFSHHFLGLFGVMSRDTIPSFGLAPMQIIDGRCPMILGVPTESGETHAHVKPRHFHAGNVHVDGTQDGIGHHGQTIEVPIRLQDNNLGVRRFILGWEMTNFGLVWDWECYRWWKKRAPKKGPWKLGRIVSQEPW